jgi:ketosteroid isomerase-like protein
VPRTAGNLEIIFSDWIDALRRGDLDAVASRLAPDVVHQGVRDELVCEGCDAVLARLRRRATHPPQVTAVELVESGDHVVLSLRAQGIGVPTGEEEQARGQATIVFTLRDGLIIRMRDHLDRGSALASIAADEGVWE